MSQKTTEKPAKDSSFNRRTFLRKTTAAAGTLALPTIVPASVLGLDGQVAPSNRITVAQIGLGVMGGGHIRRLTGDQSVEMLAICDVDRTRLQSTQAKYK